MEPTEPAPTPEPTNPALRPALELLGVSLIFGAMGGLLHWAVLYEDVPRDASFLGYMAWRLTTTAVAAGACGAVAYPFLRPLTEDRVFVVLIIAMFAGITTFHRERFLVELAAFSLGTGLAMGVGHLLLGGSRDRRARWAGSRRARRRGRK